MIRKLSIVQDAGVCSLFINFSTIQNELELKSKRTSDPQLISGFFSAILAFAEEAIGSGDVGNKAVDHISLKNIIYYFKKVNHFYFILELDAVNDNVCKEDVEELLTNIVELFESYIEQGLIENPEFQEIENADFIKEIHSLVSKTARKCLFKKK
jgi:hypothetical protein